MQNGSVRDFKHDVNKKKMTRLWYILPVLLVTSEVRSFHPVSTHRSLPRGIQARTDDTQTSAQPPAVAAAPLEENAVGHRGAGNDAHRSRVDTALRSGGADDCGNNGDRAEQAQSPMTTVRLDGGETIRPLLPSDAPLIDSWWNHRSATSLDMVARCIGSDSGGGVGACLGLSGADGELRGGIVRYDSGLVGMLHVAAPYRRRGYGEALVRESTKAIEGRGEDCVAFIREGNEASEATFAKVGWRREKPTIKGRTGNRRANRKWIKTKNVN